MKYRVIETGPVGGQWCIFDGVGPPNSNHLATTDRRLADHVCWLLNAIEPFVRFLIGPNPKPGPRRDVPPPDPRRGCVHEWVLATDGTWSYCRLCGKHDRKVLVMCDCSSDTCPQGRVGAQYRCRIWVAPAAPETP